MTCACGRRFVFDPAADNGMTDGKFQAIVDSASNKGRYYFTPNQLYAAYCRKLARKPALGSALALLAASIASGILGWLGFIGPGAIWNFVAMATFFLGAVLLIRHMVAGRNMLPREAFQRFVQVWIDAGNPLDKMLTEPALHQPPPEWPEPDIYDYGVERVLIVEHDLLVDILVRNGFHAQERALIISQNGYPEYIRKRLERILAGSNPPIFYLHDSAPEGAVPGSSQARALVAGRELIDLGLFEADIKQINSLKKLSAEKFNGRIPADAMVFTGLANILAAALLHGAAFSQVFSQPADSGSSG
jgi:hypothetical protein